MAWAYCRRRRRRRAGLAGAGQPDDAGVGDAALVDLALPALEGRVPRHGPAPRVVVVAERPADLVDAPVHLVDAGALEVRQPALVDGALLAALGAGAVVGHDDHDRVVGVAQVVDEVEHPADLLVGVGEERGEALHEALGERPLRARRGCPSSGPTAGGARARCPRGRCPSAQLAGEGLVAPAVPPLGEAAPVALDPLGRRVVGRVAGARGEVEEERQLVVDGAQVAQELDGAVGQVGAQVVALLDGARRPHAVVVVVERRARTGASRRRGSRTSGRSRDRAARWRASVPCWSRPRGSGATCRRRRWRSRWPGGSRRGSRSRGAAGPSSPGKPMARSATRPMPLR